MGSIFNTGDIVVMTSAGGWGYPHDNNGCLAIIEHTGIRDISLGDNKKCQSVGGTVINPIVNEENDNVFQKVPVYLRNDGYTGNKSVWTVRHATLEEIEDAIEGEDWRKIHKALTDAQWTMVMEGIGKLRKQGTNTNGYIEIEI